MMDTEDLTRTLLLTCLLLCCTDVRSKKDSVFVYSRLGGDALLPCTNLLSSDCSLISWTSFKGGQMLWTQEVTDGRMRADSDQSSRMSVTSNCSLSLRGLRVNDAGSYSCLRNGTVVTDIYLSLLTITSLSTITDLQPGGNISLNCILFTFYDAGNCKSYSSAFNLSWVAEDGSLLPRDSRYELIDRTSRCNITLATTLQRQDNNRKWRCQVNIKDSSRVMSLDFTSTFLFDSPAQDLLPSASFDCARPLPVSRILLCVALPVMVIIVGCFRGDCKRAKTSAANIELQEIR